MGQRVQGHGTSKRRGLTIGLKTSLGMFGCYSRAGPVKVDGLKRCKWGTTNVDKCRVTSRGSWCDDREEGYGVGDAVVGALCVRRPKLAGVVKAWRASLSALDGLQCS